MNDLNQNKWIKPRDKTPIKFFKIATPTFSPDAAMFTDIINQGIDSHLEGFVDSKFEYAPSGPITRLVMNFAYSELPILLRRLREYGTEEADQWADDIERLK